MVEVTPIDRALTGRAQFLRDRGEVKSPEIMEQAAAEITSLRAALVSIRDIEKPMFGEQPERDWLAWYSTASQMAELADDALITAKPERNE